MNIAWLYMLQVCSWTWGGFCSKAAVSVVCGDTWPLQSWWENSDDSRGWTALNMGTSKQAQVCWLRVCYWISGNAELQVLWKNTMTVKYSIPRAVSCSQDIKSLLFVLGFRFFRYIYLIIGDITGFFRHRKAMSLVLETKPFHISASFSLGFR